MDQGKFVHEFIAGNVAGIIGISVVYPLDTAKTRMQVFPHYKSQGDVIRSMIKQDGWKSLYRGLTSPVAAFGFTFALSFSGYGFGCRTMADLKGILRENLGYSDLACAGMFAGIFQSPARQIMERIKSVMQIRESFSGKSPYSWSGECAIDLVRKEGIRNGLFQGYSSVLLREVPQFTVYYPCYEYCKSLYSQYLEDPLLVQFLAGGTAGTVQWLPPIFWFDVIKSKMQTAPKGHYSGIMDCIKKTYISEGGSGFFRGFTPAMLRAFPLHAIIFLTYEASIKFLIS